MITFINCSDHVGCYSQILLVWVLTPMSNLSARMWSTAFVPLLPHQRQSASPFRLSAVTALSVSLAVKWTSSSSEAKGCCAEQAHVRLVLWSLKCAAVRSVSWDNGNVFCKLSYPKSFLNEENGWGKSPLLSLFCSFHYFQVPQRALFFQEVDLAEWPGTLRLFVPEAHKLILMFWFYFYREIKKKGNKQFWV